MNSGRFKKPDVATAVWPGQERCRCVGFGRHSDITHLSVGQNGSPVPEK